MKHVAEIESAPTCRSEADRLADLVQQMAAGDHLGFTEIYDATAPMVYGTAAKVLRDPTLAEDVSQEVFLEVWRKAPHFDRTKGSVHGWIATMAHRRAVDRVRSEEKNRARTQRAKEQPLQHVDDVTKTVIDLVEGSEVRDVLTTLAPRQRQAIELAYLGGNTYRQVAELLDAPEGTVKTHIRKGLLELRRHMGAND